MYLAWPPLFLGPSICPNCCPWSLQASAFCTHCAGTHSAYLRTGLAGELGETLHPISRCSCTGYIADLIFSNTVTYLTLAYGIGETSGLFTPNRKPRKTIRVILHDWEFCQCDLGCLFRHRTYWTLPTTFRGHIPAGMQNQYWCCRSIRKKVACKMKHHAITRDKSSHSE